MVRNRKNSGNALIAVILIVLFGLLAVGVFYFKPVTNKKISETSVSTMSPEVNKILGEKLELVNGLSKDPTLISELSSSSTKNAKLSQEEIIKLDDKWKKTVGTDDFIKGFLTNKSAGVLTDFQDENLGFPEIFATDSVGLNVGQTNKTSDYYQADEDWWTAAFDGGRGKSYWGEIEFDESAQSQSIPLYVPVYNSNKVVGVIKAVLDITSIQRSVK